MVLKNKKFIFLSAVFCVFVFALILFFRFCGNEKEVQATSADNTIGWAWSENIGWISMNCYNDYNDDGILESHCLDNGYSADYGIDIDTISGNVTGHAWSENVGWIDFNNGGSYPVVPNNSVVYDASTKELSGWAKILTLGENGFVKMQGPVVAAPASYALCRGCSEGNCDFCYEKNTDNGGGKIGTVCSACAGTPASCTTCANTYKYGVSALPYSIAGEGVKYVLEGWAWNGEHDSSVEAEPIGWIHFNYAYGNSNPPSAFSNFTVIPTQSPPPEACRSADLSWEVSSWATRYEIQRSDASASSRDCSTVAYPNSIFVDTSICTAGSCSYQDSALEENKYYCYKILAWNDSGFTVVSDGAKQVKTPLCSPENFKADGSVCGEINLTWDDKTGETGYTIYRSLTDTDATSTDTLLAVLGADVVSYKDEDIIPRHTYYYLITAETGADSSPVSKAFAGTLCYKGADWEEE